jgi:tetratricopeptide (TPR) repeat protein
VLRPVLLRRSPRVVCGFPERKERNSACGVPIDWGGSSSSTTKLESTVNCALRTTTTLKQIRDLIERKKRTSMVFVVSDRAEREDGNYSSSDDDEDIAFSTLDFTGVNFDEVRDGTSQVVQESCEVIELLQKLERRLLVDNAHNNTNGSTGKDVAFEDDVGQIIDQLERLGVGEERLGKIKDVCLLLAAGEYSEILRCGSLSTILSGASESCASNGKVDGANLREEIYKNVASFCGDSVLACIEVEVIGVAALNLYLQLNYTGPSIEASKLSNINPHPQVKDLLSGNNKESTDDGGHSEDEEKKQNLDNGEDCLAISNRILMELSVDGDLPCSVSQGHYFLFLARTILHSITDLAHLDWTHAVVAGESIEAKSATNAEAIHSLAVSRSTARQRQKSQTAASDSMSACSENLLFAKLWATRATVAHQRLLLNSEPSETLWLEVRYLLEACHHCHVADDRIAARIALETGLAQHHFDRKGKGKKSFTKAKQLSGLDMEVTGAMGVRTKFQTKNTAQLIVRAKSRKTDDDSDNIDGIESSEQASPAHTFPQKVEHSEEELLREKIKFENEEDYEKNHLLVLDQTILLALCLDVKNQNPMDGLTAEEMGAFLERVLLDHDDWMIYSTALLERAWLECEKVHGRERAILQIQALVDQHTQRLTLTQSTFKSVEEDSAPVQARLKNIHSLVYPPRWEIKADLATKYAKMGILSTAAEMFEEVEMWDEVVECYTRAGRESKSEEIIRARLAKEETPRMWAALGDITKDVAHYKKAAELAQGKFSSAYVALGKHYFEQEDLHAAHKYTKKALEIKPINPGVWFFFGTVNMRLEKWDAALQAFSEVVQQEPEEGEAWANVAAVHMRNKESTKALPALVEVRLLFLV